MQADYVVVGAGSAGCVVASRLSETGASVILLEAGPSDWHPMIHIPAGMRSLIRNPLVNWNYTTEPETGTHERRMEWPRGRVMGGSSSINGMLYVRGAPADFDGWAQMGARGLRAGRRPRDARPGRAAQGRGLPHHPAAHPPLR
jgi:choline dehydrogenase